MSKQIEYTPHPDDPSIIYIHDVEFRETHPNLGLRRYTYFCSADGDVYSMLTHRFLEPTNDASGYKCAGLKAEAGGKKRYGIAKLILATWKGWYPDDMDDPTVEHINSNRRDNSIHNLKWLEHGENASCRMNKGKGETNSRAKLTEAEVRQICKLLEETHLSCTEIGKMFHVTNGTICCIKNRCNWTYISDQYNF